MDSIKNTLIVTEALLMGLEIETNTYTYVMGDNHEIYIVAREEKSGEKRHLRVFSDYMVLGASVLVANMSDEQIMHLAANIGLNKVNRKSR